MLLLSMPVVPPDQIEYADDAREEHHAAEHHIDSCHDGGSNEASTIAQAINATHVPACVVVPH